MRREYAKRVKRVFTAYEPYSFGKLGSLGSATYMLIRQHDFPDTYEDHETLMQADHDRVVYWDHEHASRCFQEHTGSGHLESWARRASASAILKFLKDLLKADPDIKWTGFRILGSVHRGNGYPVWGLELFAKDPKSKTKVYSGQRAPNVKGGTSIFGGGYYA